MRWGRPCGAKEKWVQQQAEASDAPGWGGAHTRSGKDGSRQAGPCSQLRGSGEAWDGQRQQHDTPGHGSTFSWAARQAQHHSHHVAARIA